MAARPRECSLQQLLQTLCGSHRSVAALAIFLALGTTLLPTPALAAQSDRAQPTVLEADRSGSMDLQRQIFIYDGNAVITQGTMVMRADRIEVRQTPDGYYVGQAIGSASQPATWKQSRDSVNEIVEGSAVRIEFDGRADTLRFIGNSAVRRLRGGVVADEITGATIIWDNLAEVFRVDGGARTAVNPSGRVRAVLAPRAQASESEPTPPPVGTAAAELKPSRSLSTNPPAVPKQPAGAQPALSPNQPQAPR